MNKKKIKFQLVKFFTRIVQYKQSRINDLSGGSIILVLVHASIKIVTNTG